MADKEDQVIYLALHDFMQVAVVVVVTAVNELEMDSMAEVVDMELLLITIMIHTEMR